MSSAVEEYVGEISSLNWHRDPITLQLAYNLVFEIGKNSYGELDGHGSGGEDRPSDEPADRLLCFLALTIRRNEPDRDFSSDLKRLQRTASLLSEYGIETYFRKPLR